MLRDRIRQNPGMRLKDHAARTREGAPQEKVFHSILFLALSGVSDA